MNESEINKGRKKYKNILREKEFYLEKKKELEELKKDPVVKKYLEIEKYLSKHSDKEFEEKRIVDRAFGNIARRTEDSNNILVFLGFRDGYEKVCIHPKQIVSAIFMDLETMEEAVIDYRYYEVFCKNRKIVYIDCEYAYHDSDYYMEKFFELRNKYLGSLNELDKEEATKEILKR